MLRNLPFRNFCFVKNLWIFLCLKIIFKTRSVLLDVITVKGVKLVSASQFYDYLYEENATPKSTKGNYGRWLRTYITERPDKMAIELYDFVPVEKIPLNRKQWGRGYKRKDCLLSIDFLKQLCLDLKSPRCRNVKSWAILQ